MAKKQNAVEKLLEMKIRDFPTNFYGSFDVGDYHVSLDFTEGDQPQVLIRYRREGLGKNTELDIRDPDPELTISQILDKAKELFENFVRKQ